METYLFCLALFAVVLNVVQCVKARKDKDALEHVEETLAYTRSRAKNLADQIVEQNLIIDSHQPRLDALDWICKNPCGRKTRKFLKYANSNTCGVEGAIQGFQSEIGGDA